MNVVDPSRVERVLGLGGRVARPARDEKQDVLLREAPQDERQDACARRVEPLHVVHGDQDRLVAAQELQRAPDCDAEAETAATPARARMRHDATVRNTQNYTSAALPVPRPRSIRRSSGSAKPNLR